MSKNHFTTKENVNNLATTLRELMLMYSISRNISHTMIKTAHKMSLFIGAKIHKI